MSSLSKWTPEQQELMKQVREDLKERITDVLTPPLHYGHDWDTGEYVYPTPELVRERIKMIDTLRGVMDSYACKFDFELK